MHKRGMRLFVTAAVALAALGAPAQAATTTTIDIYPNSVPDEQPPRVANDAPNAQFGPNSWMNSATGKVNAYISPFELFGRNITIGEIASISYFTKAPTSQENWFLNIYTVGPGDGSFYGKRFFNSDYTSYTSDGAWHNNLLNAIERSSGGSFASQTLANWKTTYGTETVLFFSPQTNSAVNGNNAQIDGLVITLTDGSVGNVNFAGVPTPTAAIGGLSLIGATAFKRRRQA